MAAALAHLKTVAPSKAFYATPSPCGLARDLEHSQAEERFYCFSLVKGGVLTVRFTYRDEVIRIIGAGYWRKGKAIYEQQG